MAKYRVYSLDVWGNDDDGYEVNDRSKIGNVSFPDNASDKEVIASLVAEGLARASTKDLKHISIDGDDEFFTIDFKGKPVFQLEKM